MAKLKRIKVNDPLDSGWVYLLSAKARADNGDHFYKIGKSKRFPSVRTAEYSPKLPFETRLEMYFHTFSMSAMERNLQEFYSKYRVKGEWFALPHFMAGGVMLQFIIWAVIGEKEIEYGRRLTDKEKSENGMMARLPELTDEFGDSILKSLEWE